MYVYIMLNYSTLYVSAVYICMYVCNLLINFYLISQFICAAIEIKIAE